METDNDTKEKLDYMALAIAERLGARPGGVVLPAAGTNGSQSLTDLVREVLRQIRREESEADAGRRRLPGCATPVVKSPCGDLAFAPFTVESFYRGGRTLLDVIEEGKIPVAPGASVVLSQRPHPAWAAGCFSLQYRLANNGTNHDEVKIEWFVDNERLDLDMYGSEFYAPNGTIIGNGMKPLPLARGEQCCLGAFNRLRVRISHTGNANAIENIRLYVEHAHELACCNACAAGQSCQKGCNGKRA